MVRIATYTRQQGLETDRGGMPRVSLPGQVAAGNALQNVGSQIAGAGNQIAGLAEHMQRRADEEVSFKDGIADDLRRQKIAGAYDEARRNASADGAGFHETFLKEADKIANESFGSMSPVQREKYAARWTVEREGWVNRSASEEVNLKGNYQRVAISDLQKGLINEIGRNPDPGAADSIYERGLERIRSASALTSAEKLAMEKAWETLARTAELQARFASDPDGMRRSFGMVQGEGGGGMSERLLRKFEGFRTSTYWDVNAHRVGYGSDTITRADGSVVRVRQGDTVTREDAERDLSRRVKEFQSVAIEQIGAEKWNALNENQKAALTSITYNYGKLPLRIIKAMAGGTVDGVARAIEDLGSDNNGVNSKRRSEEAAVFRGAGKYAAIDAPLRDQLIRRAESAARERRVEVGNLIADDLASTEATGVGLPEAKLDRMRVAASLGENAAREWEAARARAGRVHSALYGIETLPEAEVEARLKSLEPKAGAEGFTADMEAYKKARAKADKFLEARRVDPALSVNALPAVRQVVQGLQYDDVNGVKTIRPESAQSLIRARLAAQSELGLTQTQAVTRSEASVIARQIRMIGEEAPDKLQTYINNLYRTYGDYADEVLGSVFALQNVNRELSSAALNVLSSVAKGQIPDISSVRRLDAHLSWKPEEAAGGSALAGMAGKDGVKPPEPPGATFDAKDLKFLWENRSDPQAMVEFNLRYPGQAERVLKDLQRRFGEKAK